MTTVGIIAEYNPFHKGHAHQIKEIRNAFGEDTRIVAVMSGNYPQRGDLAIADKYTRAKTAVMGGVDLVLELPFPFSGESAPVFAGAGVEILHALGVVDVLSFGAACDDTEQLFAAAEISSDPVFLEEIHTKAKHAEIGYPEAFFCEMREKSGDRTAELFLDANNLLGTEYIKQSKKRNANFTFFAVKRQGAGHDADGVYDGFVSSSYLRKCIFSDPEAAFSLLSPEVAEVYRDALSCGRFPAAFDRLYPAVLCSLLNKAPTEIADAGGGLYERILLAAEDAHDLSSLLDAVKTKKYTDARIRRALRNILLGVTRESVEEAPLFTSVLAMNARGQGILHEIRKTAAIHIVTKPADALRLPADVARQARRAADADRLYTAALPSPLKADFFLTAGPVILK